MYINSYTSIDILILYNITKNIYLSSVSNTAMNFNSFAIVWGHAHSDVVTVTKITLTPYYVYNHAI